MDRKDSVQEWLSMGGRLLRSFGARIATSFTCRQPSARLRADTMPGGGSGNDESGSLLDTDSEITQIESTTVTTPLMDSESPASSQLNANEPGSSHQETKASQTHERGEWPRKKPSRWTSKVLLTSLFGNMSRYGPNRARFSIRLLNSDKKVNACSTKDSEVPSSSQVVDDNAKRRKLQVENRDSTQGDTISPDSSKLSSEYPSSSQPAVCSPASTHVDSDNPSSSQADPNSPDSSHLLDSPNNIRRDVSSPESCHLYDNPHNSRIDDSPPESSHADSDHPISPLLGAKAPENSEIKCDASNRSQVDAKAQKSPKIDNEAPSTSQVDAKAQKSPQVDNEAPNTSQVDAKAQKSPQVDNEAPSTSQVDAKVQKSPQVDNEAPSTSQAGADAQKSSQVEGSSTSQEGIEALSCSKADPKATASPEIDPSTPSTSSHLPGDKNRGKPNEFMKIYKGLFGPNAAYLKLVSSDNHEFVIKREYAMMSGTIKKMLSGPGEFGEGEMNIIYLRSLTGRCVRTVCSYLAYKCKHKNDTTFIPEFPISREEAGDLLLAGHYLDC